MIWISRIFSLILLSGLLAKVTHALTPTPTPQPTWWQPSPGTTWQWQLNGEINTSYDVQMYDIDLFDTPQETIDKLHADGRIVICYFSAGTIEAWRPDVDDFPESILGKPLDDWPGERYLDIRQLDLLKPIMAARLDLAVAKGCDGVEPDNVDAYTNDSGFDLTAEDQLTYNRWLAEAAHERGLSIGLKNDGDQVEQLVDDFDWALVEECFEFGFCDQFLPFIEAGKAVFGVEYEEGALDRVDYCQQANEMGFSWLTKRLDLADTPPNSCSDYVEETDS
ncbi:MAG: endo alpha-1,4 polygalactosaminidase [Anaerolineaceae bacterium]|nr:endo alpha-1,4 polygalactosaminidase [Anaerolineaceae bacterium]